MTTQLVTAMQWLDAMANSSHASVTTNVSPSASPSDALATLVNPTCMIFAQKWPRRSTFFDRPVIFKISVILKICITLITEASSCKRTVLLWIVIQPHTRNFPPSFHAHGLV
jgi:hypothetical protein